ncbi:hypothetical protein AB0F59_29825 [Micromonospora lupini]|uniref:hypothetical protein n=1 Tax=Micromonospora lupini TaxID=285679 RepID=UPI0033E0728C
MDLKMAEAYTPTTPEGGSTDEYRCQVIAPGLTKTAFVTGTQFAPENVAIAHHAIVYAVPPDRAALVRKQDAKTPGLGWQCFGGTGVPGADVEGDDQGVTWVDTWAPGATETLLDQDIGFKLGAAVTRPPSMPADKLAVRYKATIQLDAIDEWL